LLIVFFLCGLWHGANVTFIVWGLWHGLFLIIEKLPTGRLLKKLPKLLARSYTLFIVLIGWVFFRAENLQAALSYIADMFTNSFDNITLTYHSTACIALILGLIICLAPDYFFNTSTSKNSKYFSIFSYILQMIFSCISLMFLISGSRNPFIYFNF
jgi:alginate O-acetyltransferase complex protein AlgI